MKNIKRNLFLTIMAVISIGCISTPTRSKAANQKNWQSIYADESYNDSFIYYVKYGNLLIARNDDKIYIKNKNINISKNISPNFFRYGGVLTNGKDVMYQHKRNVYLLKNAKSKRKLFSLKKKGDILVARYGNDVFFERYRDLDSHDVYQYNLKTNKVTKTKYDDAYYCNGKYLIINGNFHEGAPTPLRLYNMKTRKIITIAKNGLAGNAAIIRGNSVYYTEHYNKNMKSRLFRYDIKTKKKTMLKKNVPAATWLDQNHYYYQDSMARNIYVYNLKTGEKTTY